MITAAVPAAESTAGPLPALGPTTGSERLPTPNLPIAMSARSILLIAGIVALQACAAGDEAARANTAPAAPNVVSLTAAEYTFQAPDSIPAGWTTFRLANHGAEIHYGHIVQLEPGRSVQELVAAYEEAIRTSGPRPSWVTRFGGPGGTAPGDSSRVTQHLEPGNYVWICPVEDDEGHPHFAKGEVKPFVVHAARVRVGDREAAPEATMAIRLLDFSFAFEAPPSAGRHTVRVENAGREPHDLVLLKLAPGKTVEDVAIWLNPERARRSDAGGDEGPPSLESLGSLLGGIAAIGHGMEAFFEANLTPGEYVLVCMATAPDGQSHIEHGMIQQFRVE